MNRRKFFSFLPAIPVMGAAVATTAAASLAHAHKEEEEEILPKVPTGPVNYLTVHQVHVNGQLLRGGVDNDYVVTPKGIQFYYRSLKCGDVIHLDTGRCARWTSLPQRYGAMELVPFDLFE